MKKLLKTLNAVLFMMVLMALPSLRVQAANGNNMYRLYNPNSGEHFYTAAAGERDSLTRTGWHYEGIGWVAPKSGKPVYRLYNPNAGDHHYTTSAGERDSLMRLGWKFEKVGWYSGGSVPLYRQYNPHAKSGAHNYTTNKAENDALVRAGWRAENIGWYGISGGRSDNSYKITSGEISSYVGASLSTIRSRFNILFTHKSPYLRTDDCLDTGNIQFIYRRGTNTVTTIRLYGTSSPYSLIGFKLGMNADNAMRTAESQGWNLQMEGDGYYKGNIYLSFGWTDSFNVNEIMYG